MIKRWQMVSWLFAVAVGWVSIAAAHCDSMDGPVVTDAREALAAGEVTPVLKWISAEQEPAVRDVFTQTMEVRQAGETARELADRHFFETLVRLHRATEGAPFTGLKPAHTEVPEGIAVADRALAAGEGAQVVEPLTDAVAAALRERFEKVSDLRARADLDVATGRAYVAAYVDYIHFVEALHQVVTGHGAHGADSDRREHAHREQTAPDGPMAVLEAEHDLTMVVLAAAERDAEAMLAGAEPDPARVRKMLDFYRVFVDECHHAKEERYLFPALRERAAPQVLRFLDLLETEHEAGQDAMNEIEQALTELDAGAGRRRLAQALLDHARLLRAHIQKENGRLLPLSDSLAEAVADQVAEQFRRYEHEVLGEGIHEKYHGLAKELKRDR